jgi:folate-binding protein YgfZ
MNVDWRTFLKKKGAVIERDFVSHFGAPDDELSRVDEDDILCDLSHQGLLAISGDDAKTFLQGQLSNDVNRISDGQSQLSAYCSPKGRMLALFRLFERDNDCYLVTQRERVEPVISRLQMFVLMSKVVLKDASDELIGIGLSGPNAVMLLTDALGKVPDAVDEVYQNNACSVLRLPGEHPRFAIYSTLPAAKKLWQKLTVSALPVGADIWRLLDIRSGIPAVYNSSADAFVPQMTNLQLLAGISFDKGCYVGQEIVARTKYLGRLKRRMYRVYFNDTGLSQPGTELYAPALRDEQSVGKLVDACRGPDGGYEGLAVLVIECADDDVELVLGDMDGVPVDIDELPYDFEDDIFE